MIVKDKNGLSIFDESVMNLDIIKKHIAEHKPAQTVAQREFTKPKQMESFEDDFGRVCYGESKCADFVNNLYQMGLGGQDFAR